MKHLDATARFKIKPGELENFKKRASKRIETVREKEKGIGSLQ